MQSSRVSIFYVAVEGFEKLVSCKYRVESGVLQVYRCPVCGFPSLEIDPKTNMADLLYSYDICICCGSEFGFDVEGGDPEEVRRSILLRRKEWIAAGHKWFSDDTNPPRNWNWKKELGEIGVDIDPGTTQSAAT